MRLAGAGILLTLLSGGCILPCPTGTCDSGGISLYRAPTTRWGPVEKTHPDPEACRDCKPNGYFTLAKYWPWMDEVHTTNAAKRCAKKILLKQQWQTRSLMGKDYKYGFVQAFIDVANGSEGEIPAVPPPRYWNTHYRTPKGQRAAEQWFDGYRAGVAMAPARLDPLNRITASYDWCLERPKAPPRRPCSSCPPGGAGGCATCSPGMIPAGMISTGSPQSVPASSYSAGIPPGAPGMGVPSMAGPYGEPVAPLIDPNSGSLTSVPEPPAGSGSVMSPGHSGTIPSGPAGAAPSSAGNPQPAREGVLF